MIIRNKKATIAIPVYLLYICIIMLLVSSATSVTGVTVIEQAFSDKAYCYLIVPPFTCAILLISESIKKPCLTRMESRKQALLFVLIQQYAFSAVYLVAWFAVIVLFAKYCGDQIKISEISGRFVRYLFSLLVFSNLSELFKRVNVKALRSIPFVVTYVILIIDVLAITAITGKQSNIIYLIFSWAFFRSAIVGTPMLGIIFIITLLSLYRINRKADYF